MTTKENLNNGDKMKNALAVLDEANIAYDKALVNQLKAVSDVCKEWGDILSSGNYDTPMWDGLISEIELVQKKCRKIKAAVKSGKNMVNIVQTSNRTANHIGVMSYPKFMR